MVGVRPEEVRLTDDGTKMTVAIAEPLGAETHLLLRAGNVELRARVPGFNPLPAGSEVSVSLAGAKLHFFAADESGKRLLD